MRKTLTLAVACAAFGFALGRSSRGHTQPTAFALETAIAIERPTGKVLAPAGPAGAAVHEYESVPLRVSRVIESGTTKSVSAVAGGAVWRLTHGPTTYVLTP
jgi:hypothetical protein